MVKGKVQDQIHTIEPNVMICQDNWSISLWYASCCDVDHTMGCFYVMFL
jgi:hypothetical protein